MNRTRPKQIVIRVSEEELAQIKKRWSNLGRASNSTSLKHSRRNRS